MRQKIKFKILFLIIASVFFVGRKANAAITLKQPSNLGLVGYWSLDEKSGTIAGDMSGNGNNGAITGTSWATGKRSGALDVSNGYVRVPDDASLNVSQVSISFWMYPRAAGIGPWGNMLVSKADVNNPETQAYGIFWTPSNQVVFRQGGSVAPYMNDTSSGTTTLPLNQWSHVSATYDGTISKIYVNGVLAGTSTPPFAMQTRPEDLIIGSTMVGASVWPDRLDGIMDEVRIYNRALALNEVSALHRSGSFKFSAPPTAGLTGYWSMEDGTGTQAGDMSGNGLAATLNGATWISGKRGKALSFNGSNAYAATVATSAIQSQDFSVSFWVNPGVQTNAIATIMDYTHAMPSSGNWAIQSEDATTSKNYYLAWWNGASWDGAITGPGTGVQINNDGAWKNVTYVKSGANIKGYLNGTLAWNATAGNANIAYSSRSIDFGYAGGIGRYFNGSLDEIRMYNRPLSVTEISRLYSAGASKINSSQNNRITNGLVGLWSFNGADMNGTTAYDRSGNGNNGTLVNGPTQAIGKIGQALNFTAASTQKITVPSSSSLNITGSMTTSAWVWLNSLPTPGNIMSVICKYDSSSNAGGYDMRIYNNGSNYTVGFVTNNGAVQGGTDVTFDLSPYLNQWMFLTAVYDGANVIIHVDGNEIGRAASTINPAANAKLLNIGSFGYHTPDSSELPRYLDGKLDEVRLYNRALSSAEINQLYYYGEPKSTFRRYLAIDNAANTNTLSDYQVSFTLDTASLIASNKMRSDCGDIRVYDTDGATALNYYIESGCNTSNTKVWVKVPSIPASSTKTINLVYGKLTNPSQSSGSNVFAFFEDFESGNMNNWTLSGNGGVPSASTSVDKHNGGYSWGTGPSTCGSSCFGGYTASAVWNGVLNAPSDNYRLSWWRREPNDWGSGGGITVSGAYSMGDAGLCPNCRTDSGWYNSTYDFTGPITSLSMGEGDITAEETVYHDDIIIRKYSTPEPSVSVGAER
jgi:hypothetical protein